MLLLVYNISFSHSYLRVQTLLCVLTAPSSSINKPSSCCISLPVISTEENAEASSVSHAGNPGSAGVIILGGMDLMMSSTTAICHRTASFLENSIYLSEDLFELSLYTQLQLKNVSFIMLLLHVIFPYSSFLKCTPK